MKTKILTLVLCLFIGINSQAQSSTNRKMNTARKNLSEAKSDLKKAKSDSIAEYKEFRKESMKKIVANEKKIAEMKKKQKVENKESQAKYDERINLIERKNISLQGRVDEYRADGNTNWAIFKKEFNEEMLYLQKTFSRVYDKL